MMDDCDDFKIDTTCDILTTTDECVNHEITPKIEVSDEIHLQPAWSDDIKKTDIKKTYDCLDITKVLKKDKSIKKMKCFTVESRDKRLRKGLLDFYRCTDGNRDYTSKKHVSFAICHPKKECMITGSEDCMLGIFKVDGEENKGVCKPFYLERFPIKGGRILPDGNRVAFYSKYNSFRVFNMTTSKTTQHFIEDKNIVIKRMEASPAGDIVVFCSKDSIIYIVSTSSFDVVDKLHVSGKVRSMAFSHRGKYLYAFGAEGVVYVFEFKESGRATFLRKWTDHGCINGSSISISPDDQYVACGSSSSIVNVYNLNDTWQTANPRPVKTLQNFGRVNLLAFNHSSEILAMGSTLEDGSQRLVHLASMTIFTNFPGPMGAQKPTSLSFSPNDKYLAVGQSNGKVALYNIKYYNKY